MGRRKKLFIPLVFSFFCFLSISDTFADFNGWEEVFKVKVGRILCMESIDGTQESYLGTDTGLYETLNGGKSWERVDISGGNLDVKDIAIAGEDIFLATGKGLYMSRSGASWEWVPGKKNVSGVVAYRNREGKDRVLVWSEDDLFKLSNGGLERVGARFLTRKGIDDVACQDDTIYIASGGSVFESSDEGNKWNRIPLLKEGSSSEEVAERIEEDDSFEEINGNGIEGSIDPSDRGGVVIATTRGIFYIGKGKGKWCRTDTTGLPSTRVKYAAESGKGLFVATDKMIFLHSGKGKSWQPVFDAPPLRGISFLKASIDNEGREWLWVANGKSLFKGSIDFLAKKESENQEKPFNKRVVEPSIREVHRMAISYAEVSPEKIRRWRRRARWKALLPKLSFGFNESTDDKIEIYTSSTRSYHYAAPREVDAGWDVDLTWDLSDLIWNESQTSIDVRSKLMVQLRNEILEDVTRLYFERKKLLAQITGAEGKDEERLSEKQARVEELTAYIDALTGGRFSEAIKPGK